MNDAITIGSLTADQLDSLVTFFSRLSARDLTFIKEDVTEPETVRNFINTPGQKWVATQGAEIIGYLAVLPLAGWSDHVGEIRLVVDGDRRGEGIGRTLVREAVAAAPRSGMWKLVVELAAQQERPAAMFQSLGFTGEALLRNHFRDRNGELRDLVMLAHFVDENLASMATVGIS